MKLTDEQIRDCWDRVRHITGESPKIHALAREVEAEVLRGITGDGRGEAQRACETLAGCPDSNACREASQCQYGATPPQQEQAAPGAVQDGWMPIETAPKTTKSILVHCSEMRNTYVVAWSHTRDGGEGWVYFCPGNYMLIEEPTHWMPLPAAPKAQEPGA